MQVAKEFKLWKGGPLWEGASEEQRRAHVLPYSDEYFLAFGAESPSGAVRFVVQGSLGDEMDAFIAQMESEGAEVTVTSLSYENQEPENPPDPKTGG